MSGRTSVNVYSLQGEANGMVDMPEVFNVALRPDLIRYVHTNMRKNQRQAYAVASNAGYQTSAKSWGTGRALARIPRVSGSGTHRSGQAAYGNMCRGGGMYSPTKTYRRWHRRLNVTEKRHAVASALAACAVAPVVMARGHKIDSIKEIPLVVSDEIECFQKTKDAVNFLKSVGCADELKRVADSRQVVSGKRRYRHGKYTTRRGPLVVYSGDSEQMNAFRNIPGIDLCHVSALSLLQLAPGGVLGRLVIFSKSAFSTISSIYEQKKGYSLPRGITNNIDVARIINSPEVQAVLKPKKTGCAPKQTKLNPLRNVKAVEKLSVKSF